MHKILFLRNSNLACLHTFANFHPIAMSAMYNTSDVAAGLGYNTKQLPYMYSAYMHIMELYS